MQNWSFDEFLKSCERITVSYKNSISIFCCLTFVLISAARDWQVAAIVSFISLFALISFEILKRVVIELGLKKLWGVEFDRDFREEEKAIEAIKDEIKAKTTDTRLSFQDIDNAVDSAVSNVSRARIYHKYIEKTLDFLGIKNRIEETFSFQKSPAQFDFIVKLKDGTDLIIEAKFVAGKQINQATMHSLCKLAETIKDYSQKTKLLIITNSKFSDQQVSRLESMLKSIDIIDDTGFQGELYDKLRLYFINNPPDYKY